MDSSFRFGLLVGFVAGLVMAALWDNDQEWDADIPAGNPAGTGTSFTATVTEVNITENAGKNDSSGD